MNSLAFYVFQVLGSHRVQTIHKPATEIEDELEQQEMLQTGSPTGSPNATASSSIK